ncbi:PRTRC system ThiF family protein [Scytonema hofmannii]|nr:PRTRC system ThiF family protein [Scytonema hofmannii]
MILNFSYTDSCPIIPTPHNEIQFYVVGAGGTGSYLVPGLARLITEIKSKTHKKVSCTIVDPDTVEEINIPRQNFQKADIGLSKAKVLAMRYGFALGLEIKAIPSRFTSEMVNRGWRTLNIIVGCVDNADARNDIRKCLDYNTPQEGASVFWLDCGNHEASGQVLLGTKKDFKISEAFDNKENPSLCINLPSPTILHPELLIPKPEEKGEPRLSCAEIQMRNFQSLFVNQTCATHACQYLLDLTLTGGLRKFATYFDCISGTSKSLYTCRETLNQFSNKHQNHTIKNHHETL